MYVPSMVELLLKSTIAGNINETINMDVIIIKVVFLYWYNFM